MEDIREFVLAMNRAWVEGRFDDLRAFFHDQVVMLMPASPHTLVGREPMIQSYREFAAMAAVHRFEITDLTVYPFGTVVMCHARFTVDYTIPSGRFEEEGLELYAVDVSAKPTILWRTQVALHSPEP